MRVISERASVSLEILLISIVELSHGYKDKLRSEMAAALLRQKQAPIKDHYRNDPSSAVVTLHSSGMLDSDSITCSLDSGPAIKDAKQRVAGLHKMAGGEDAEISGELCSGEMSTLR